MTADASDVGSAGGEAAGTPLSPPPAAEGEVALELSADSMEAAEPIAEAEEEPLVQSFELSDTYDLDNIREPPSRWRGLGSLRCRRLAVGLLFVSAIFLLVGLFSIAMESERLPTDGRATTGSATAATHKEFELLDSAFIAEYNFTASLFRHRRTGAQVFSIQAPDANKRGPPRRRHREWHRNIMGWQSGIRWFWSMAARASYGFGAFSQAAGVAFRTPVTDDRGKPHVLEHCLLGGSRKYPAHAPPPFDRLAEGSLFTYLNAETFPDRTLFPVASRSARDLSNLLDVYLDALFDPLVGEQPHIFQQEAWHYALADAEAPGDVDVEGVVLNEMKGVLSDPSARLAQLLYRALFPDTTYRYESGGMPMALIELELSELMTYYHTMYHPGNAHFYFYGDDAEGARLARVAQALRGRGDAPFDPAASAVEPQPAFDEPRKVQGEYPSHGDGDAYVVVSWALTRGSGGLPREDEMALLVLQDLLLGDDGALLTAALLDMDVGADVVDDGLDTDTMQPTFTVGLLGVRDPSDAPAIHDKVLAVLEQAADSDFDADAVAASLHRVEMGLRAPAAEDPDWGVTLLNNLAGPWVWRRDLSAQLSWKAPLDAVAARLGAGKSAQVFAPLIRSYLLDNPHRVDVTMAGSARLAREEDEARAAKLADVAASMPPGSAAAKAIVAAGEALAKWQEGPDSPDDVDAMPQLAIGDVPGAADWVDFVEKQLYGSTLVTTTQPTAGLLYATLALDLGGSMDPDDVVALPLLAYVLGVLGAGGRTPEDRAAWEGANTGGVSFSLLDLEADEAERLVRRHVARQLADLEADFDENTLDWASAHAAAMLTPAGWMRAQMERLPQVAHLREAQTQLKAPGGWRALRRQLKALLARALYQPGTPLGGGYAPPRAHHPWNVTAAPGNHALLTSEKNNHIAAAALVGPAPLPGCAYAAAAMLDSHLNMEVREKRGAYGAYATLGAPAATFEYSSYRDPELAATLAAFRASAAWLADTAASLPRRDLVTALLGGVRELEPHRSPSEAGRAALLARLGGATREGRQAAKDALLGCDAGGLADFAATLGNATFFVTAAARQGQAEAARRPDGMPLFDELIPLDDYFTML
eukprot:jgi/Tetstr1/463857/TSEL_008669.t1